MTTLREFSQVDSQRRTQAVSKRRALKTGLGLLAALSGLGVFAACQVDSAPEPSAAPEPTRGASAALYNQSVTFEVVSTTSSNTNGYDYSSDTEQKEHCYVSADLQTDFPAGTQIRIGAGSHLGLCTVQHNGSGGPTCPSDAGPCYRIAIHSVLADKRLGQPGTSIGSTFSGTASNEYSARQGRIAEHKSWPSGSFSLPSAAGVYEYLIAPTSPIVAYTAPHGSIEDYTRDEVDYILEDSDPDSRNAGWVAQYRNTGGGTNFDHFHITSGDLSEDSFVDLGTLFTKKATSLRYAVSFHGFNENSYSFSGDPTSPATCDSPEIKCTHVIVGGDEDLSFRKGVAELLNEVLPSGKLARADGFSSSLWGVDDDNFVNRLAAGGKGLQLEQSSYVRTNYAQSVADTVQSVYDCLIDGVDVTRVSGFGTATSPNANYATTDRCPRFIAEIDTTATGTTATSFNAGMDTAICPDAGAGGSAHVDYYRWDATSGQERWIRIGGGRIDYDSSCAATKVNFEEPSAGNSAAGLFRAVVRATWGSSPGTAQIAFFTMN